jgi:hypothetical protein
MDGCGAKATRMKCRVCDTGFFCVCESCIGNDVCEHVSVCNDCTAKCSSPRCYHRTCYDCLKACKHCLNGFCYNPGLQNCDWYHARQCVKCDDYACSRHTVMYNDDSNVLCLSCAKGKIDKLLGSAMG